MTYLLKILPVQNNQNSVVRYLTGFLGPREVTKARDLVRNGGIVRDDLTKSAADKLAKELREMGAVAEVVKVKIPDMEKGYQLTLLNAGSRIIAVIKAVREITGLGLKEAKELVDNLGAVGTYKTKKEAEQVKKKLASLGVKVDIKKLGGETPEPEPRPEEPEPKPEPTEPENGIFIVFGQVLLSDGQPVEACLVRVFDRDLRSEQFLGESVTDGKGAYKISYTKEQFKRAEKGTADLLVRAYNSVGKLLSESDIRFNSATEERIDLEISNKAPVQPSEYEQLVALLKPLLEGVPLSGLTSDDVWFLTNETGRSLEEIAFLADDARLAQRTGMPEAVFFGLGMLEVGVVKTEEVEGARKDQQSLPFVDLPTVLEEPVENLIKILKTAIENRLIPVGMRNQLDKIEERFADLRSFGPTESVGSRRRRLQKLGQIAGLPDESAAAVARRMDAGLILPEVWEELVIEGVVPQDKIDELKLTVELGKLTEDSLSLTEALKSRPPAKLGGPVASLGDLAVLEPADWERVVLENEVAPPGGKSISDYAGSLAEKVEKLFPTEVFQSRVLQRNENQVARQLHNVHSLLEVNSGLFSKSVRSREPLVGDADLDFGDRVSGEIKSLRSDLQELNKLARTFRHLGVAEILDRTDLPAKDKAQTVGARLDAVDVFFSNNKDIELKSIDFFGVASKKGPTQVSYAGIDDELQPLIRQQMMAHQRVMNVAPDATTAIALLQGGYDSAAGIAAESSAAIARKSGIGLEQARDIRTMALDRRMRSLAVEGVLLETDPSNGSSMHVLPQTVHAGNELKKIDGYKEHFGSQSYCSCRHCASILSPAAYFGDLMRFVEKHVSSESFGDNEEHVLHLRQRRPDLWTLPLTCKNTNTLIPYLDIINGVLEQYIQTDTANAYEFLSSSKWSFRQPFHLPLEELRTYLQHFSLNLSSIAEGFRGWGTVAARESLRLSPEEWDLLTQTDASNESVYAFYGWQDSLEKIEVQLFLKATGLTRSELDRLISLASIIRTDTPLRVVAEKDDESDLQPVREVLMNLSVGSLSRIHRFVRLWRKVPWEMEALDYVLRYQAQALLDPEATPAARSAALGQVATLRHVQHQLRDVALDVMLSLVGPIPLEQLHQDEKPLFDRLFNAARLAPDEVEMWNAGSTPSRPLSPAVKFWHSALAATNVNEDAQEEDVDEAQHRLVGALGVSDADLVVLLKNLLRSEADDEGTVDLTHENLSLLHRHAKIATRLGISVDSLFTALRVIQMKDEADQASIESLTDLRALLTFLEWQRESDMSIIDIHFIVRGSQEIKNGYSFDEARLQELSQIASESIWFTENVFTAISDIQPQDVDVLLALLVREGMIETPPGGDSDGEETVPRYHVTETYNQDASLEFISGDPEHDEALGRLSLQEEAILQVLTRHKIDRHSAEKSLLSSIAEALGINQEFLRHLFTIVGQDIEDLDRLIALKEKKEELRDVYQRMEEAVLWVEACKFDVETLEFIVAHPDIFGLKFGERMELNSIRLLSSYAWLRKLFNGKGERLIDLLSGHGSEANLLAELVEESSGHVRSFLDNISPAMTSDPAIDPEPVDGIDRLMQLLHAIDLGGQLGLDGRAFKLMISDEHGRLAKARDLVLGAFRAKYDDDAVFEEAVEPFRDRLRGRRRDALVDFILNQPFTEGTVNDHYSFEKSSDLYHYFLLDTELEGCARTSRIVAATNSLQLYVHRCLMGLEQSKSGADEPVRVTPTDEMLDEWPWRKNYRVWEANRKVFLHTENFLDPDLRDNKSPLFRKLEDELLQQDINADTVEAAYLEYLKDFTEIAKLKIVGACYDEETRTTHVFGKSVTEPGRLFHRKMVKLNYESKVGLVSQPSHDVEWTSWEELDLKADMDYLSPIVVEGQLHLLWVERRPKTVTEISGGSADTEELSDYVLKVSRRMVDGGWSQPAAINLDSRMTGQEFWIDMKIYPFIRDGQLLLARFPSLLEFISWSQGFNPNPGSLPGAIYHLNFFRMTVERLENSQIRGAAVRPFLLRRLSLPNAPTTDIRNSSDPLHLIISGAPFRDRSDYAADVFAKILTRPRFLGNFLLTRSPIHSLEVVLNSPGSYIAQVHDQSLLFDFNHFIAPNNTLWPGWESIRLTTPVAETLTNRYYRQGLNAFLSSATQKISEPDFPVDIVHPYALEPPESPDDRLDFTGPFGLYYRELFLHIPLLLANHLNANQRFEEAQQWYHYVFNPVTSELPPTNEEIAEGASPVDHYWNYLEFKDRDQDSLNEILRDGAALEQFRRNPFNPHAVARMRLNAYRKSVVMKYVDNLVDWGDHLFAQDTRESINEATLLYVMAADILGDRPVELGSCEKVGVRVLLVSAGNNKIAVIKEVRKITGFSLKKAKDIVDKLGVVAERLTTEEANEIKEKLEAAGATVISEQPATSVTYDTLNTQDEYLPTVENVTASLATTTLSEINKDGLEASTILPGVQQMFCVPHNEDLLAYWDRVGDRLFKIRNCMNLSGVRRELALFAPPIDPALLVRAKAAGLSLESALALGDSQVPPYRFTYISEKAKSYAATVQGFGSALLSALEKKDAEELMLLRATHQLNLLALTKQVKEQQIKAAVENLEALKLSREVMQHRKDHYASLLCKNLSVYEQKNELFMRKANNSEEKAYIFSTLASFAYLLPQLGAPTAITFGGKQVGAALSAESAMHSFMAARSRHDASMATTQGGYDRREEEWAHQKELAEKEIAQIDKQLLGAEIQVDIAERGLEIHQQTVEQEEEVFEFYSDKFSSFGLYTWLSTELNKLHRMAYNMAHEVAQVAQAAYHYEHDSDNSVFIQPGHWDSHKAGLLAGDRLVLQLQQMEKAFIEHNERAYEITKHVSLAQLDPLALVRLRSTGECDFDIPEVLYDMDHPGQYSRRLKSVSVSLPCIAGPHTSVNAKLSLVNNRYRKNANDPANYPEDSGNDERFVYNVGSIQSIATSNAQNDSGVFELNFRDERYLPFEYAGAISSWRLELPTEVKQFDYNTITDVVLHVKYTAREGGSGLKTAANEALKEQLKALKDGSGLQVAINMKHEFPNEWNLLKKNETTELTLDKSRLPYMAQSFGTTEIESVMFVAKLKDNPDEFSIQVDDGSQAFTNEISDLYIGSSPDIDLNSAFSLSVSEDYQSNLEELLLIINYTL
ncbi:MAG: ribosomal protein L7/L12 [Balneolaceae bacterium]|nr:ribosomal protein L7/L12 [Balneolaceae bacterium]